MSAYRPQILVADDDPEIRKLLGRYIEGQSFRVQLASSCGDLRERLASNQIDLMVLDVKLPDDKLILPGVVSHATNVVEHPELVAERIGRFTQLVGRERVIAENRSIRANWWRGYALCCDVAPR